jgi:lysozyme
MEILSPTKEYTIDLSHQNAPFDWDKMSPAIKGVILKYSQGATYRDPIFTTNLSKVRAKGLILGVYHFLNFTDTAELQATNFLSADISDCILIVDVENQKTDDLDLHIEHNPKNSAKLLQNFLDIVEAKTGKKCVIYTYRGFWTPTLNNPDFRNYPLWVANYDPIEPHMFGGWSDYALWQFSQRGSHVAPGDGGDIDWSVVNEKSPIFR